MSNNTYRSLCGLLLCAVGRLVLGSVSQKVVTEARCSVRVARSKVDVEPATMRLIIGVDGGPGAVGAVASRAWPQGSAAQVVAVHEPLKPSIVGKLVPVVSKWIDETNTEETSWIRTEMEKASERLRAAGLSVTSVLLEGDPWAAGECFFWEACLRQSQRGLIVRSRSCVLQSEAPSFDRDFNNLVPCCVIDHWNPSGFA